MQAKQIAAGFSLAEGPVWDAETQTLFWVDIERHLLLWRARETNHALKMPQSIGCVVPLDGKSVAAAVKNCVYRISLSSGQQTLLWASGAPDFLRFNDGKCDAQGRLWVGTMAEEQSHERAAGGGSLYCVQRGTLAAQYPGFTIPNGMAWSQGGERFYHVDTALRAIFVYDVCGARLTNRRVVRVFEGDGQPDGMCIDTNGRLWTALWGGYAVVCIDPATGALLQTVDVPDKYVSCCAFGGADLRTLYVTTARDEQGNGGALWRVETGARGVAAHHYMI